MKRIDRKYAIVYIDYDGESLVDNDKVDNFTTDDMITDYYNNSGFLQWNYYLIIPKDLISEERIQEIEKNDIYTRKFVIDRAEIDSFIDDRFPEQLEKSGEIELIKGNSWNEIENIIATNELIEYEMKHLVKTDLIRSYYRDLNSLDSLEKMDILRAKLIKEPNYKAIFYTHLGNEFGIAEKKFKLFNKIK